MQFEESEVLQNADKTIKNGPPSNPIVHWNAKS